MEECVSCRLESLCMRCKVKIWDRTHPLMTAAMIERPCCDCVQHCEEAKRIEAH